MGIVKRLLIVGERENDRRHDHRTGWDPFAPANSAFKKGRSRERLEWCGLDLNFHIAINLVWPWRARGKPRWNPLIADENARIVEKKALVDYDGIVLLGKKVCAAFRMELPALCTFEDFYLVFPHPSGLNRFWNDHDDSLRARTTMLKFRGE